MFVEELHPESLHARIRRGDSLILVDAETADTWLVSGGRADRLGFEEAAADRERLRGDRAIVIYGEPSRARLYARNLVQQNFPRTLVFVLAGGRDAFASLWLAPRHTGDEEVFPTVW
jgi:hypothetical protein